MPGEVVLENVLVQVIVAVMVSAGVLLVALLVWCLKVSSKVGGLKKDVERLGRIEDDIRHNREAIGRVKEDVDRGVGLRERTVSVEVLPKEALEVGGLISEVVKVEEGEVSPMPEYRKKKGSDTWHWCRNCSNWPESDYDSTWSKPTSGELDNECRAKEKAGDCTK